MHKGAIVTVAALVAAAAVLGTLAATNTVSLGAAQHRASDAGIAKRTHQLDRFEASLRRALARKPPALPKVPAAPAVSAAAAPAAPQPHVVYRRPPAVVVVRHTQHGDDGEGREAEGERGDD
ncbi:MAG TPA: hypothetical protein VFA56_10880 [Gaiellaceae bacterium]|nr:hypothetical protein [Gaiellaceae bacterium]